MPPTVLRALLSPLVLLIIAGSKSAFGSRQECSFPVKWEGTWFQSGVRQPIQISRNELSSKGTCLRNEGDKFLLYDKRACYRCVVIHEKHSNVLQYKETYCHDKKSLASLCSFITGDALLYSMFREDAPPVPCPFRGPMTFSYNRGHGTCSMPQSNVDTCTDDSRLLFRYQACPDVPASESAVEELECLATWKEGSSRYLVGRLHHGHASSNEDRYRCFVYEKAPQSMPAGLNRATLDQESGLAAGAAPALAEGTSEVYRVAQSGDATCNGLLSPMEGSRTMTLKKASSPGECRFPNWLTGHTSTGLTWHTLDLTKSYTFHPRNASLHVTRSNGSLSRHENGVADPLYGPGQEGQEVRILCNRIKQTTAAQSMTLIVAHFTVGCQSGYMCMAFYRRDGHVIEVQTGSPVSRPEEACSSPHFQENVAPFLTLVTSSPEPRQCPYLGKFTVTEVNRNQRNVRESKKGQKVRHGQEHSKSLAESRRVNNDYLVTRERVGRSNRRYEDVEDAPTGRARRNPRLEDFQINMDEFARVRQFWAADLDEAESDSAVKVQADYFGDYPDGRDAPKKRSHTRPRQLATYSDLVRMRRDLDAQMDDSLERREKREEEETATCNSEVTMVNIGCSTADRMEFHTECEDFITAYSCHGRWFDAEGTQFVIATPLARRTPWPRENNRLQPYRNTRRLCFMYKEHGGVVSLTASPIACQRGIPPPQPLLAFNATSIGHCMEDNGSASLHATITTISLVLVIVAIFR